MEYMDVTLHHNHIPHPQCENQIFGEPQELLALWVYQVSAPRLATGPAGMWVHFCHHILKVMYINILLSDSIIDQSVYRRYLLIRTLFPRLCSVEAELQDLQR